ncbi:MAG TPA: hypothetical protein VHG09_11165 [Longimicrobiales bacterium]|nr:hypothetical protein [Longimicrobiales bacterium]
MDRPARSATLILLLAIAFGSEPEHLQSAKAEGEARQLPAIGELAQDDGPEQQ